MPSEWLGVHGGRSYGPSPRGKSTPGPAVPYISYISYVGDANADDPPPGSTDQMDQISKDWDPNLVKKAPTSVNLTLYLVR